MGRWKEVKLKDVIQVINGRAYKKPELLSEGKYRVLRVGNLFTNNSWYHSDLELPEDKYCEKGDLIYAWSASFGPRIWHEEKVIYHYHIWKMVCDEKVIDKDFAFQFLDWDKDMMKKEHSRGVGMFHLTKSAIENRKLVLPPLSEQKRIVVKLDGLFAKIDKAVSLLEANITHTKALMGSVLDEELSRFNTKTSKIKDVLSEINSGFACNKSNEIPDGYVHLRTHNIDVFGNLNFDKMIKINPNKVDQKKNKIRKNDILFNNTNSKELVGKTALVDKDYDYGYSNHLTRIRLNEDLVLPEFFVNYMINLHSQGYFLQICKKWIGQAGVNTGMLKDTEIKFPSIQNQIILNKMIDSIKESSTELINKNTQKLTHLKALKSSLLDQAFKGEL